MNEKRKKFWIRFAIVCTVIVVFCFATLKITGLKTVAVEFVTREENTQLSEGIDNKIISESNFAYGKSLLFVNFDGEIEKIEKRNPYVKVVQVIREFPNIARIRIAERTPLFRVKDSASSSWYILDENYKILKIIIGDVSAISYGDSNYKEKTIELELANFTISGGEGDFVSLSVYENYVNEILSVIKSNNGAKDLIDSIKLTGTDDGLVTKITMNNASGHDGLLITFDGNEDIAQKTSIGWQFFKLQPAEDLSTKFIKVSKKSDGKYIAELQNK